jgi:intracellular sulfur oxidation DsrE/DsrF family protein
MAKTAVLIFHDDDASLRVGASVSERMRQAAPDVGVEIEVFVFGPAQAVLSGRDDGETRESFRGAMDELIAHGVVVGACVNVAKASEAESALLERGVRLDFARDVFLRWGHEGAAVLSF